MISIIVAIVLVPVVVLFLECCAALWPAPEVGPPSLRPRRIVVLIPAHDEQQGIAATVQAVGYPVLVVADNCTDGTAATAYAAGARVIERSGPAGKGFALDAGFEHLAKDPPDVVVVLDADCRMSWWSIARLAETAVRTGLPVQARNTLTVPPNAGALARVSAFAFLVKNHVRSLGRQRLSYPLTSGWGRRYNRDPFPWPCTLQGTGMAFPWQVHPTFGGALAEDVQTGLELLRRGYPPVYCPEASVTSPVAPPQAARGQRRRWEHGHLAALWAHGPRLLVSGHWRAGLDLAVPPLALLALLLVGACLVAPVVGAVGVALFVTAVGLAWVKFGRVILPARYLMMVPLYIAWKLPMYLSRPAGWVRTAR